MKSGACMGKIIDHSKKGRLIQETGLLETVHDGDVILSAAEWSVMEILRNAAMAINDLIAPMSRFTAGNDEAWEKAVRDLREAIRQSRLNISPMTRDDGCVK